MRNIKKLAITDTSFEIFLNIIDGKSKKNQEILTKIKDELKLCFDKFDTTSDLYELSSFGFESDNKNALLSCYNSKTDYSEKLKSSIKNLDNGKCPYCNIDKSRQVEHYIPKEEFPEYSFNIYNLIPTCGVCNGKKGNNWRDITLESRLFLNSYFDNIPNEQFLFVKLYLDKDVIISDFYLDTSNIKIDDIIDKILKQHVEKLNLIQRYSESINEKITELKYLIEELDNITLDNIKEECEKQYRIKYKMYGENYWEAVLYNEISKNNEILKYLLS